MLPFFSILLAQAFNYISNKGYSRVSREDEKYWADLMMIHDDVRGGIYRHRIGTLLMVLSRPVRDAQINGGSRKGGEISQETHSAKAGN